MSLGNPLNLVISNVCCHFLSADLCEIYGDDSIVEGIEHAHQSQVHPGGGRHTKYNIQSKESSHHGDVAEYSDEVTNFVNEQEPFIHKSWGCSLDWLLQGTFGDKRCDGRENQPDTGKPPPVVLDTETQGNDPHT